MAAEGPSKRRRRDEHRVRDGRTVRHGREASLANVPLHLNGPPIWDDEDGHYIVHQREDLTDRYLVQRIVGQGTFGKVVHAWDRYEKRHCAIKIVRAVPKYREASRTEIRVLNTLKDRDPTNSHNCIHLRDSFDYRNHVCMVFDLYGMSIYDFMKANGFYPFPLAHIQLIARQLLSAVAFIHSMRLVHTDLKPENILLVSDEYTSIPMRGSAARRELRSTDIRLIDFGSATFQNAHHTNVVSTRHYRAPEVILGLGWSYPCDLWSVGCILVELYTGEATFQTHENLEHLALMERVLGRFPEYMIHAASSQPTSRHNVQKYFKNYVLNFPNETTSRESIKYVREMRSLQDIINLERSELSRDFYDLVSRLLEFDPVERITARTALRHPFVNG